eukprot:scaffold689_cov375-Prasinococcus_capsulatus_cf.AAC.25
MAGAAAVSIPVRVERRGNHEGERPLNICPACTIRHAPPDASPAYPPRCLHEQSHCPVTERQGTHLNTIVLVSSVAYDMADALLLELPDLRLCASWASNLHPDGRPACHKQLCTVTGRLPEGA